MPRFSIIVPTHGVAGRLGQALDSVLAQSFGDLELIPVCDTAGSPAADVAAGHAERDSRVVPVHAPPSEGLAGARNAGVRAATGTYLLFLDGDDLLLPGALAALDALLADTGPVDVLPFEHERVPWWEGEPTSPAAPLLAGAPDGAFAPSRAPHLTGVRLPAWSTAWRRAFVTEHELAFPPGHFTDVGWGGRAMLHAERLAVLRRVLVRHRARRQGDRLRLPGPHHADLLDQAERVLDRAAALALPAERSAPLFDQLFAAVLKTATHPGGCPPGGGRSSTARAPSTDATAPPATGRPVAAWACSTGCWRPGPTRRSPRCATPGARPPGRRRPPAPPPRPAHPAALRPPAAPPLDPDLAVYCAYWGRGYACNPAAIHAKARELAPHLRGCSWWRPTRRTPCPTAWSTRSSAPTAPGSSSPAPRTWSTTPTSRSAWSNAPGACTCRRSTAPR